MRSASHPSFPDLLEVSDEGAKPGSQESWPPEYVQRSVCTDECTVVRFSSESVDNTASNNLIPFFYSIYQIILKFT